MILHLWMLQSMQGVRQTTIKDVIGISISEFVDAISNRIKRIERIVGVIFLAIFLITNALSLYV